MNLAETLENEALVVFGKVQMLENEALVAHGRSNGGQKNAPPKKNVCREGHFKLQNIAFQKIRSVSVSAARFFRKLPTPGGTHITFG